jgi:hypothetical protein
MGGSSVLEQLAHGVLGVLFAATSSRSGRRCMIVRVAVFLDGDVWVCNI